MQFAVAFVASSLDPVWESGIVVREIGWWLGLGFVSSCRGYVGISPNVQTSMLVKKDNKKRFYKLGSAVGTDATACSVHLRLCAKRYQQHCQFSLCWGIQESSTDDISRKDLGPLTRVFKMSQYEARSAFPLELFHVGGTWGPSSIFNPNTEGNIHVSIVCPIREQILTMAHGLM